MGVVEFMIFEIKMVKSLAPRKEFRYYFRSVVCSTILTEGAHPIRNYTGTPSLKLLETKGSIGIAIFSALYPIITPTWSCLQAPGSWYSYSCQVRYYLVFFLAIYLHGVC